MKGITLRRFAAGLLVLVMLCGLAFSAQAASGTPVGVKFWREHADQTALENDGVDAGREALLTRQANGTYTLSLPILSFSRMGMNGHITGLTIGDITYDGEMTGQVEDGSAMLQIKNLPASVLTGPAANQAMSVVCNIQMEAGVLGQISTNARMTIWKK